MHRTSDSDVIISRIVGFDSGAVPQRSIRFAATVTDSMTQGKWCLGADSNHRHADFQSAALPTELPRPAPASARSRVYRRGVGGSPACLVAGARAASQPRNRRRPAVHPAPPQEWRSGLLANAANRHRCNDASKRDDRPRPLAWRRSGSGANSLCRHIKPLARPF